MAGGVWGAKVEALVKQQVCVGVWDHHSGVATCLSRTSRFKIAGSKPYNNQMRKMFAWCAQNVLGIVGAAQLKHYTSTLKSNFSITNWIKSNWSTNPSIHHGFVPWKESKYINQKQEKNIKQMYKYMKPSNSSSWSFCTFYMPKVGHPNRGIPPEFSLQYLSL